MVKTAYEIEGIDGLAKFYFQNIPPTENPVHNKDSFFRLVRSLGFQKKVEKEIMVKANKLGISTLLYWHGSSFFH